MDDFVTRFRKRRENVEELTKYLDALALVGEDVGPFVPYQDREFWEFYDRIYAAGLGKNTEEAPWLAGFTQVDDLGPNGRAMFLAFAALEALQEMPEATLAEGKRLWLEITRDASCYRKVGVGKVLEASGYRDVIPLIERLAEEHDSYVRQHTEWMIQHIKDMLV